MTTSQDKYQRLEAQLTKIFQLENFSASRHAIRNNKGWLDNKLDVEYIWLVVFHHAFLGSGGFLNIKFNRTEFRGIINEERLVKSIFSIDTDGSIFNIYKEDEKSDFTNLLPVFNQLDLLNANKGITLDGVGYRIKMMAANISTIIEVNNPDEPTWKIWEKAIWKMGIEMAKRSNNQQLTHLFKE